MGRSEGTYPEQKLTLPLIIRPKAEAEMTEAFDWYEDRSPGLGSEFLLCVDAAFNDLIITAATCTGI